MWTHAHPQVLNLIFEDVLIAKVLKSTYFMYT